MQATDPAELHIAFDSDRAFVSVAGELDAETSYIVGAATKSALAIGPRHVVLDMSGVSFIDCAGLRGLLMARSAVRAAGKTFFVSEMSPSVRRLLELSGDTARLTPGLNRAAA